MVAAMTTAAAKAALRRALLGRRAALDAAEVAARSQRLTRALLDDACWQGAGGVAAFVGVGGEPETAAILAATLGAGKRLALPRVESAPPRHLDFVLVDDLAALVSAPFGLREPAARPDERRSSTPGPALGIDLVLVPGLAFAWGGARLGFGKGYYDRALAPLRGAPRPLRLGVCFAGWFDPPEGPLPCEAHDVPVHGVLTDEGIQWWGRAC